MGSRIVFRRHQKRVAREVFAEEGLDASGADVAERAGVGTATIFRRFPTKDDLLAAVVERRLAELAESARAAAAAKDPAGALRRFMQTAAAMYIGDRGFCESGDCGVFASSSASAPASSFELGRRGMSCTR